MSSPVTEATSTDVEGEQPSLEEGAVEKELTSNDAAEGGDNDDKAAEAEAAEGAPDTADTTTTDAETPPMDPKTWIREALSKVENMEDVGAKQLRRDYERTVLQGRGKVDKAQFKSHIIDVLGEMQGDQGAEADVGDKRVRGDAGSDFESGGDDDDSGSDYEEGRRQKKKTKQKSNKRKKTNTASSTSTTGNGGGDDDGDGDDSDNEGANVESSKGRKKKEKHVVDQMIEDLKRRRNGAKKKVRTDAELNEITTKFLKKMEHAADEDLEAQVEQRVALHKIKMLPEVVRTLRKVPLHGHLIANGLLFAMRKWLEPSQVTGALVSTKVRTELLKSLLHLRIDDKEELAESGIGKVIMFLLKSDEETRENKDVCRTLVDHWTRPILGIRSNYKDVKDSYQVADPMYYGDDEGGFGADGFEDDTAIDTEALAQQEALAQRVDELRQAASALSRQALAAERKIRQRRERAEKNGDDDNGDDDNGENDNDDDDGEEAPEAVLRRAEKAKQAVREAEDALAARRAQAMRHAAGGRKTRVARPSTSLTVGRDVSFTDLSKLKPEVKVEIDPITGKRRKPKVKIPQKVKFDFQLMPKSSIAPRLPPEQSERARSIESKIRGKPKASRNKSKVAITKVIR